jgi:hypothetical protein
MDGKLTPCLEVHRLRVPVWSIESIDRHDLILLERKHAEAILIARIPVYISTLSLHQEVCPRMEPTLDRSRSEHTLILELPERHN